MIHTSNPKPSNHNQSGLASIVVTMIIMIVISLIVLAAAQLARRGQRQALDRQLSTQAFYAAESGVHDALKAIKDAAGGTLLSRDYTDTCNQFITDPDPDLDLVPDLGGNVKYSCLLVDPTPITWEGTVGDSSRTMPIRDANGGSIRSVTIAWQAKDAEAPDFGNCTTDFNPVGSRPCTTPILRFDLVSTTTPNPTRAWLNSNVMTGFLIPVSSGSSSFDFDVLSQTGFKQTITCSVTTTPKYCKATIIMPLGPAGNSYYLRIKSIYGPAVVTVSASENNSDDTKMELKDAQLTIDSTGKAADVLRRIQVRVPLSGTFDIPEFAIQSGDAICKRLLVNGLWATTNPADSSEPACQP